MTTTRSLFAAVCISTLFVAPAALADELDKQACAQLADGDDCTRGSGDAGVCVPDESDPNVLTCEDESVADSRDDGGCSVGGSSSNLSWLPLVGLGLAAAWRRRRASSS